MVDEVDKSLNTPMDSPTTPDVQPSDTRTSAAALDSKRMADAERSRQRQALELQRERVLSERTSSPHRRSALEGALADIEEKLGELGWTLHL